MKNFLKLITVITLFSNVAWANKMTPMQEARLGTPSIPGPEYENEDFTPQNSPVIEGQFDESSVISNSYVVLTKNGPICFGNFHRVVKITVIEGKLVFEGTNRCVELKEEIKVEGINKNFNHNDLDRKLNNKNFFLNIQKGENATATSKNI